jgi:hypothetical protein
MRKSRVLLAGVAVAAAAAATSAFTASNTFTVDNNVAGYGEMVASGVTVTNVAYAPATNDATKLHSVTFTVDKDTTTMAARMSLLSGTTVVADVSGTDCVSTATTITCTLTTDLLFTAFTKTGLTVTSN